MIINNLDLRIFDFVNVVLISHFYHEPPARETGQPLPVYLTVNKLYLYLYLFEESEIILNKQITGVAVN